jgi:hypothetical protein
VPLHPVLVLLARGDAAKGTVASGPKVPLADSRFPSRRPPEVLKAINPGIADGIQEL